MPCAALITETAFCAHSLFLGHPLTIANKWQGRHLKLDSSSTGKLCFKNANCLFSYARPCLQKDIQTRTCWTQNNDG